MFKKIITLTLVAAMALALVAPASASTLDDTTTTLKNKLKDLNSQIKDVRKQLNKVSVLKRILARPFVLKGELVSVAGLTPPTTLTVKLTGMSPKRPNDAEAVWPEIGKELTVKITEKTQIVRRYWGKSSLEELTPGDKLHIVAKRGEDGVFTATVVKDESIHVTFRVHNGKIESIDAAAQTFVLKQNNKRQVTVKVSAKTKLFVLGVTNPTFADLKVGMRAHVRGVINNRTKTIDASLVRANWPLVEATPTSTPTPVPAPAPTPTPAPTSTTST
ncbi:hypothetical protein EPN28_04485 [Patescibacteria group bacterium]|nr:MAG: hypothetical protein EPN28_04485 [Patescibacteria group bacterium]